MFTFMLIWFCLFNLKSLCAFVYFQPFSKHFARIHVSGLWSAVQHIREKRQNRRITAKLLHVCILAGMRSDVGDSPWLMFWQLSPRIIAATMDSSTNLHAPPHAAYSLWSCDKVYHKQEVCFLSYFLDQIVSWQYYPNLLD